MITEHGAHISVVCPQSPQILREQQQAIITVLMQIYQDTPLDNNQKCEILYFAIFLACNAYSVAGHASKCIMQHQIDSYIEEYINQTIPNAEARIEVINRFKDYFPLFSEGFAQNDNFMTLSRAFVETIEDPDEHSIRIIRVATWLTASLSSVIEVIRRDLSDESIKELVSKISPPKSGCLTTIAIGIALLLAFIIL